MTIQLPQVVLVDPSDAERLRQRWSARTHDQFWLDVQKLRQAKARLILEEETFLKPADIEEGELPIG